MEDEIVALGAQQVIDCKCRPAVEVVAHTASGASGRGCAPTGSSVGMHEAFILRDGDPANYNGLSVHKAVEIARTVIGPALVGMNVFDQRAVDRKMIELDGTPDKRSLGGNTMKAIEGFVLKPNQVGTISEALDAQQDLTEREVYRMLPRSDFLYLSEPDMIGAGVLDAARCVEVCEETFKLLGDGDYLMGGANHNNHGMNIVFPKETKFPNMPVAGPDRRFAAMPGYLGGRFDVCGNKWYGSNHANASRGLPRSILTLMLNDKDTGAPLALMSANLLSAARTGAVPGVGAKYLARNDSRVVSMVGCGPINKACFTAIMTQLRAVERVVCFDLFRDKADAMAAWVEAQYGIASFGVDAAEAGFCGADVITVAASRLEPLEFKDEWIKDGATILVSGPVNSDESFWTNCKIVYDHTPLQEAYVEDAIASGDRQAYYDTVIGGPLYRLIDDGKLPRLEDSIGMGDIVNERKPGREDENQRIVFVACGMAVFDISWGYEMYENARREGIGQELNLWTRPHIG